MSKPTFRIKLDPFHAACNRPKTAEQSLVELDFERGIWSAALNNEMDRLKTLCERGDANKCDSSGYTPLHYAARNNHYDICRVLISFGADVNAKTKGGATALHRAAMMGYANIVQLLLSHKAIATIQDEDGNNPLHRAVINKQVDIMKILIAADETVKCGVNKQDKTPADLIYNLNEMSPNELELFKSILL